jgi:hypothetical protein
MDIDIYINIHNFWILKVNTYVFFTIPPKQIYPLSLKKWCLKIHNSKATNYRKLKNNHINLLNFTYKNSTVFTLIGSSYTFPNTTNNASGD